ncbi:MAG: hypothetical protein GC206_01790 [Alphaproteobacteria bacterium]|nr:hypothetical protein [Alphaproteobacteria bacterium]
MNLYGYVGNDPLTFRDPLGMDRVCASSTGSRIQSCVSVDGNGDGDVSDNDLSASQERAFANDFRGFILNNNGADISGAGKTVGGTGSDAMQSSVRVTSQFVGAAIGASGDAGLQDTWRRLTGISVGSGGGAAPAMVGAVPPIWGADSRGNGVDLSFSSDLTSSQFRMVFTGRGFFAGDFYGSPTNLARVMIHETLHGRYAVRSQLQHRQLDAIARGYTSEFGLGHGGCWAGYGFPGGC